METVDTAAIGAGVSALAAARALAERGGASACWNASRERVPDEHAQQSGDSCRDLLPAGSLKARHCVAGARMLYAFCETYNIPFKRCGKLIVVHDDAEIPLSKPFANEARPTASKASTSSTPRSFADENLTSMRARRCSRRTLESSKPKHSSGPWRDCASMATWRS